jgi:hypothetical protein
VNGELPILNSTLTNMPEGSSPAQQSKPRKRGDVWLQRLKLAVEVIFFVELGMLLVVLPWTPLWSDNSLLVSHLSARAFLTHGFVRGALTGLGLINVWIGVWDAVHYREEN